MWKYNETSNLPGNSLYHGVDELYHYGVLGMRWHHKKGTVKKNAQRSKSRISKGSTSAVDRYYKNQRKNMLKMRIGSTMAYAGLGIGAFALKCKPSNVSESKKRKAALLVSGILSGTGSAIAGKGIHDERKNIYNNR